MKHKDYSKYKLNVIESPYDSRDWLGRDIYPDDVAFPLTLDHRPMLRPVRDQGTSSACAAFAGSGLQEYQERVDIDLREYLSPQYIYNNREDLTSEGMYMRDLMIILKQKGVCLDKLFPVGSTGLPSKEVIMEASTHRILNYVQIKTIDYAKTALFVDGCCIVAFPVYNYSEKFWYQNTGDEFLGGHAVLMVGYNAEGFIIRNSWGTDWAQGGYTILPYDEFILAWEIWSCIDMKSIDPTPEPDPTPDPEPEPTPDPIPEPGKNSTVVWIVLFVVALAAAIWGFLK